MERPSPGSRTVVHLSAAEDYHEASKLHAGDWATAQAVWIVNNSPQIRSVVSSPATSFEGTTRIPLATGPGRQMTPLHDTFLARRSARNFGADPVTLDDLASILYYATAVVGTSTDANGTQWGRRCAPSGGALYPLDIYCFVLNMHELDTGRYSYDPKMHTLELLSLGDYRSDLAQATYVQTLLEGASVCIVLVANFPRMKFKYGERTYRFALLEAGHVAQNILLAATALDVGSLPVGGFVDDHINDLIGVDGVNQAAIYSIVLGSSAD